MGTTGYSGRSIVFASVMMIKALLTLLHGLVVRGVPSTTSLKSLKGRPKVSKTIRRNDHKALARIEREKARKDGIERKKRMKREAKG